jgi:hypothetical protein
MYCSNISRDSNTAGSIVLVFLAINYSLSPDGPLSGEDRMHGSVSSPILIGAGQDHGERSAIRLPKAGN